MKINLGDVAYTRSGDKGPNVNIGIIFTNEKLYKWALKNITDSLIKNYFSDMVQGSVIRYELPNLNAFNFIFKNVSLALI